MKRRVLLATNSRDRGSTSRTLESWARLLPAHGIEPIVTIGGDGPLLDALRQSGITVYEHPIRFFFERRRPLPFLSAIAQLAWRIRRSGADLVHVNEHEHYPVVARAAYLAGVPTLVHIRFKPEAAMCRWLFKPPYTPQRVFFTSRTQMHDSYADVASAVPPDRFQLIYNGLDFNAFGGDRGARARIRSDWKLEPTTFAIGTASSISPRKRLSHFIRLVVNLAQSGLPVKGFIAGRPYFAEDEREMAALQRLVSDLGAEQLVTFLGYVEPAEPLYHGWDLCLSTSEYETFGMTMLEAMACGCPVLAYPGGSVAEIIGDGGTVVPDGDLEALTATCARFVTSESHRAEMAGRARRRAEVFDVRRSVEQLVVEYQTVHGDVRKTAGAQDERTIRSTWLTINPNLEASARSLQDWIRLGTESGMTISVILQRRGDLSRRFQHRGVPHTVDAMYWPDRSRFLLSASHAWKLRRFLAAQGTQVLHCYEHDVYPFAVMVRSMTSLPLVCHVHFALEREFCEWAFGGSRKLPDALIWTSRQQQRDCEDAVAGIIPSERQYVIPLGLDPAQLEAHPGSGAELRQRLGIAPQTIVIGLTCAFRPRKQIETFLELIQYLTDRYTNVVGILAGGEVPGDEAYAREVSPRIEALQSQGRFFWLGHVEPIGPFLDATDIYVSTSNYETFGMGVLEAMATGKAIAAYRGGSVYEVLGSTGLVVDNDARDDLFHAVESLIESDALRRQFGAAARQRVADEFDPRRSLEQIQDVYRKLLRR